MIDLSASRRIRSLILKMSYYAGKNGAHVGSALSSVEIISSAYDKFEFLNNTSRDTFILSKGHAALCHFAVLANKGILTRDETKKFNQDGSDLFCHSKSSPEKNIEFSGGSLGLGLSYSVGLAIYLKAKNLQGNIVCMVGDGELDEGICWEALSLLSHKKLDNILVIVDNNKMQSDGQKSDVLSSGWLTKKMQSFGLKVDECDGHSLEELNEVYDKYKSNKVNVVVANSIKGKGVSFMENNPDWHYGVVSDKVMEQLDREK